MNDELRRRRSKLLTLPAILIVAVVTQAPILATLGLSLVRWIVVRPDLGITFIGLDNYAEIFTSRDFYEVGLQHGPHHRRVPRRLHDAGDPLRPHAEQRVSPA